ncbi:MAG TPA: DUF5995 family protein [Streptosporangiaceae bacterium]
MSIDALIGRMEALLGPLAADGDPRRYFHATYLRTTRAVRDALRAGWFGDPDWVERWDVAFADLYLDALQADSAGGPVPGPWAIAFRTAREQPAEPALRHVLLGMNAHINYDLPQALLAVISGPEFGDPELLRRRQADHQRIDEVLSERVGAEDAELAGAAPRSATDALLAPLNRTASRRFLREARAKVWDNTIELNAARSLGADAYAERLGDLEALSAARVAELVRPGQVLLRLAVHGFGVRLVARGHRIPGGRLLGNTALGSTVLGSTVMSSTVMSSTVVSSTVVSSTVMGSTVLGGTARGSSALTRPVRSDLRGRRPGGPRSFDPARVADLEFRAWVGYYRRDWASVLRASVGLVRAGFGMSWPRTLQGAWLVLRANQLWAPADNDPDGARRCMQRFYGLVRSAYGLPTDIAEAARLEVEWWRVHRAHQHGVPDAGQVPAGQLPAGPVPAGPVPADSLVDALATLYAFLYQVPHGAVRPAAAHRAHAMDLSDQWVAEGCRPDSPLLALEHAALVRSYAALLAAVHR